MMQYVFTVQCTRVLTIEVPEGTPRDTAEFVARQQFYSETTPIDRREFQTTSYIGSPKSVKPTADWEADEYDDDWP